MNEDKIERLMKLLKKESKAADELRFFREAVSGDSSISQGIRGDVCESLMQAEKLQRQAVLSMLEAIQAGGLGGAAGNMQQSFDRLAEVR